MKNQSFKFRGLKFREYEGDIGLQVRHDNKWVDVAVLNRRELERDYNEVPDIALWEDRRHLGSIRFISLDSLGLKS